MARESPSEVPLREIERSHAAAVELADETRRIVHPALVVDGLTADFGEPA